MWGTVELPVWLLVLILVFAGVTFASHFLFPSVRWFFRIRLERAVTRLNTRLDRPIQPFKLARRYDMIQRLSYDTEVHDAIVEHARSNGVPESVAFETAQRYAREIVPAFSAAAYFGFGIRVARWLSQTLYRVRVRAEDEEALKHVDPEATVIFVMNHRSNMDYVLVTYLVSSRSALSYAVGEWARVWPLRALIRSMGAYFIRRKSRNALYRRVLARYVQMATDGGVAQAIFPEGGLSLTGRLTPPKLGLLSYVVDAPTDRPVFFVPVALSYDRVLEDRVLIQANAVGERKFPASIPRALGYTLRQIWKRMRGKFDSYGYAAVHFGAPVRLEPGHDANLVGQDLMRHIARVMPALPVPLLCEALLPVSGPVSHSDLIDRVKVRVEALKQMGAQLSLPETRVEVRVQEAIDHLKARGVLLEKAEMLHVQSGQHPLLTFYATSIKDLERALTT